MDVSNIGKKSTAAKQDGDNDQPNGICQEISVVVGGESNPWLDWGNRLADPEYASMNPTIDTLSQLTPKEAAQMIVKATFAEQADPRIPLIDGITTGWDFRKAYWEAMIIHARCRLGLQEDEVFD